MSIMDVVQGKKLEGFCININACNLHPIRKDNNPYLGLSGANQTNSATLGISATLNYNNPSGELFFE